MTIWTGQNSDTVYVCGLTGSNIAYMLGRYTLTDSFLNSLSDTKGNLSGKIVSSIICKGYEIKRGIKLYPPQNSYDMYSNLNKGILMMSYSLNRRNPDGISKVDANHVRCKIGDIYQSSHLTGMDHQIIRHAGGTELYRNFPFSTVGSMMMFRNIKLTIKDITNPKYYIGRYLKEFWGQKEYRRLYPTYG